MSYLVGQHESDIAANFKVWCGVAGGSRKEMSVVGEHGREVRELSRVCKSWRQSLCNVMTRLCLLGSFEYESCTS